MSDRCRRFLTIRFLFAAMASMAIAASAQTVPVGATGQALIARFFVGIDCQTQSQTGFGTGALYFPYIAGIPEEYLFRPGATVRNETTAVLTGVFSKAALSQSTNYDMVNVFLKPQQVKYYYHPDSSPKDWTDFDGFQAGQLIATYQVQAEMFSMVKGVAWGVVSGPFVYSADFVLPDGTIANLQNFMPGGITAHTMAELGTVVLTAPGGPPQVVDLRTSKGPFALGSCAVMTPFSGTGTNPAAPGASNPGGGRTAGDSAGAGTEGAGTASPDTK